MRRFSLVLAALLVLPPAEARAIDSKTPGPGRGHGSPQLDGQLLARGGGTVQEGRHVGAVEVGDIGRDVEKRALTGDGRRISWHSHCLSLRRYVAFDIIGRAPPCGRGEVCQSMARPSGVSLAKRNLFYAMGCSALK